MTAPIDMEALRGHTAGPWHVGDEHGAEQLRPSIQILRDVTHVEGVRPTTYVIGSVTYPTTTGNTVGAEERRANARLIAAAPALLAELTTRRARDAEVEALVAAGINLIDRYQRDGEDVVSRFERIAAMFKRDTGFTAPGKDISAAAYAGKEWERERDERWNAWCLEPVTQFREALATFTGGQPMTTQGK